MLRGIKQKKNNEVESEEREDFFGKFVCEVQGRRLRWNISKSSLSDCIHQSIFLRLKVSVEREKSERGLSVEVPDIGAVEKCGVRVKHTIMGNTSFGGMAGMNRGRWVCRLGHRKLRKFSDGFCSCCEVGWTIRGSRE